MSSDTVSAKMETCRFRKLPPELRNMIHFDSGLDEYDMLALTVYLSEPEEECALVQNFMFTMLDPVLPHEGTLYTALVVQQTIYHTGAVAGSLDWDRYKACKQALYNNYNLILDETRLGVKFVDMRHVMLKTKWAYMIRVACNGKGWEKSEFANVQQVGHVFEKISKTEVQRLILAVHQFDVIRTRLDKDMDEMTPYTATRLAEDFFECLTPWEKEQILCIPQIMYRVFYNDSIALSQHDDGNPVGEGGRFSCFSVAMEYDREMKADDRLYKLLIAYLCKTAAGKFWSRASDLESELQCKTLPCQADVELFVEAVQSPIDPSSRTPQDVLPARREAFVGLLCRPVPWSALLEAMARSEMEKTVMFLGTLDEARLEHQMLLWSVDSQLNIGRDRDREPGPKESWESLFLETTKPGASQRNIDHRELNLLREAGYAFWDSNRTEVNCCLEPEDAEYSENWDESEEDEDEEEEDEEEDEDEEDEEEELSEEEDHSGEDEEPSEDEDPSEDD